MVEPVQTVKARNYSASPRKEWPFSWPKVFNNWVPQGPFFPPCHPFVFLFLFPLRHPYQIPTIDSIGIDIWTMDKGILFDNIVIDKNPEKVAVNSNSFQSYCFSPCLNMFKHLLDELLMFIVVVNSEGVIFDTQRKHKTPSKHHFYSNLVERKSPGCGIWASYLQRAQGD